MMRLLQRVGVPLLVSGTIVLALSACSGGSGPGGGSAGSASPAATVPAETSSGGSGDGSPLQVDCAAVEAAVAPYIEGLVAREDNGADEYGTLCGWEAPEGTIDAADIRSVEVVVSPEPSEALSVDELAAAGLTPIPDATIEAAGGIAYSATVETGVAAVIVTTVVLPDTEVSVTGGQWAGHPSLDGPAAVAVVKALMGR
ncbi:hypothetical protein BIU99_05880 [Plantibacter sp. MMLR14_011]|nr:hypothetical protein BIU99_05880 [Plantibacter sp. MMLR14_011]